MSVEKLIKNLELFDKTREQSHEDSQESVLYRRCPHCGTVWEDSIAALTCPCLEREEYISDHHGF